MPLRLWHRLFLAFATLSVLALAGFAAWQQQSFRRGFLGYLDEVALARLEPAAARIASAYAENGGWDFLRDRERRFGELVEDRARFRDDRSPPDDRRPPPRGDGPLPPGDAPHEGPPPPGPPGLMPRLLLVDASGARIVGNPRVAADAPSVPVELDGRRIATLRLDPQPEFTSAIELAFAREQRRNAILAGIAVLGVALVLALVLARWLLTPVRALAAGTRALAAGDFSRRVDAARSDELGRLAADFNDLAATLERHREARRRWGADIAHELRTPLAVLRGEIQALEDGVRAPTPAALASLSAECERLGSLIEDLYQLSLADAGALEYKFEDLDLGEVVRDAIELHEHALADRGLAVECRIADGVRVRGDARRLAQLVGNLLTNAERYTDAPGRVVVEVARTSGGARVAVDDSAPGVPAASLPRLFDRLYRVEASRSRGAGGAGLGLSICRAIADAHGARIEAKPSTLGGLRVAVDFEGGQR